MSWKATGAVKPLVVDKFGQKITMAEKMVLLVLSDYVNDETGTAWPSVPRLAAECLISDRQCQRVLQALSKREMLTIQKRRDGERNLTSIYTLTIGDIVSPSPSDTTSPSGDIIASPSGDIAVSPKPSKSRKETKPSDDFLKWSDAIIAEAPPTSPKSRNVRKYAVEKTVAAIKKIAESRKITNEEAARWLFVAVRRWKLERRNEDAKYTKSIGSWMNQETYTDIMAAPVAEVTSRPPSLVEMVRQQRGVKHGS